MQQHLSNEFVLPRFIPATTGAICHFRGPNCIRSLGDLAFNEMVDGQEPSALQPLLPFSSASGPQAWRGARWCTTQSAEGELCTVAWKMDDKTLLSSASEGLSPGSYPRTRQESKQPFRKPCRLCWITNWGRWSQQLYYLWKWKITSYTTATTIHAPSQFFAGSHHLSSLTNNYITTSVWVRKTGQASGTQCQLPPCAHVICIFRMLYFLTSRLTKWLAAVCNIHVCWF